MQGLGYYLSEEALIASDGQLQSKGTWTYKPLMATDLPQDWRVELLENGGFDKGFLSSKASGTQIPLHLLSIYPSFTHPLEPSIPALPSNPPPPSPNRRASPGAVHVGVYGDP